MHDTLPQPRAMRPPLRLAPRKAVAMRVFDTTLYQIYPLGMSGIPCLYYGSE